jgi:hypothetical protein
MRASFFFARIFNLRNKELVLLDKINIGYQAFCHVYASGYKFMADSSSIVSQVSSVSVPSNMIISCDGNVRKV